MRFTGRAPDNADRTHYPFAPQHPRQYTDIMYVVVAKQLVIMMLIVVLGFLFGKLNKTGAKETEFLSRMLLYFVNPCLIVNAFNLPFDEVKLRQLGAALVV